MGDLEQLPLFADAYEQKEEEGYNAVASIFNGRELGTFKDSMRAPIHRWFRYPAGYSYKFVFESFDLFDTNPGDWVYDPFSGTGTTLICAKQRGIHAYGVEAHSFVHWVASAKLYWEFCLPELNEQLERFLRHLKGYVSDRFNNTKLNGIFPDLVYKCYHPEDLKVLYLIRQYITQEAIESEIRDFLKLALTDTLRSAATAGTGWPYISPRKNDGTKPPKNALIVFVRTVRQMYVDLTTVTVDIPSGNIQNVLGDSRERQNLEDGQIALALTSPPYLNNYDYADRTRLETYFWGIARSWKDITHQFRDKLMVAATTQIIRGQYEVETALSDEVRAIAPDVYALLQRAILLLSKRRLEKGGKKDYDLMVALYCNHMTQILTETYRVLREGGRFLLVLGDSAPYGVHIPTEEIIGQIGLGIGFSKFDYHELRRRGGKWRKNPQRHNVPLREGIVILQK